MTIEAQGTGMHGQGEAPEAAAGPEDGPPPRLCVEDEPNILAALRRLFRGQPYRVLTAESAAAGLALLEQEGVELVISDRRMPEMNGAACRECVNARWPGKLRLPLTGSSDVASIEAATTC